MDENKKTIITVLLSGGFLGFVQFLITFWSDKHDKTKKIEEENLARYEDIKSDIDDLNKNISFLSNVLQNFTQEMRDYNQSVGELVVGLGQDKLIYLTEKYRKRGGITLKEKAALKSIYIPYHVKLNGNGYGEIGFNYCMNDLPVISDSEAIELDERK